MFTVLQVLHACSDWRLFRSKGKKIKRDFCNWRWSAEEKGGERSNGSKFNFKCHNSIGGIGSGREEASCGAGDCRLKCSWWWVWKSRKEGRVRNGDSFYCMWTPEVVGSTLLKVNVSFSPTAKIWTNQFVSTMRICMYKKKIIKTVQNNFYCQSLFRHLFLYSKCQL